MNSTNIDTTTATTPEKMPYAQCREIFLSAAKAAMSDGVPKQVLQPPAGDRPSFDWPGAEKKVLETIEKGILADPFKHYVSCSNTIENLIAFSPDHHDPAKGSGKRVRMTLMRYFVKYLVPSCASMLSLPELERLAQAILAEIKLRLPKADEDFLIVSGPRILETYLHGHGIGSCMSGEPRQAFLTMYSANPDRIQMLLYANEKAENGVARALLWTTDQGPRVLDRIYPNEGPHVPLMKRFALSRGFVTRIKQGVHDIASHVVPLSDRGTYTVTIKPPPPYPGTITPRYPYLDTFRYGRNDGDTWVLSNAWDQLCHTDTPTICMGFWRASGQYDVLTPKPFSKCERCKNAIHEAHQREMVTVITPQGAAVLVPWCSSCAEEFAAPCSLCGTRALGSALKDLRATIASGYKICPTCFEQQRTDVYTCHACKEVWYDRPARGLKEYTVDPQGRQVLITFCPKCTKSCLICMGRYHHTRKPSVPPGPGDSMCDVCASFHRIDLAAAQTLPNALPWQAGPPPVDMIT